MYWCDRKGRGMCVDRLTGLTGRGRGWALNFYMYYSLQQGNEIYTDSRAGYIYFFDLR
jgi:hypothetical protein